MIVTGPSFSRDTFISAPKIPVSTVPRLSRIFSFVYSQSNFAFSGHSASIKDGRFHFLQFAHRVNWLTDKISPPISIIDRFIFPCSSSKIRKFTSFFTIFSTSAFVSHFPIHINNTIPTPILPIVC